MWNEVLIPGVPVDTDRTGMREAVGGPAFGFLFWFVLCWLSAFDLLPAPIPPNVARGLNSECVFFFFLPPMGYQHIYIW